MTCTPLLPATSTGQSKVPRFTATCRILYLLCKVRGEKVISRFLPTDAILTETILTALENGTKEPEELADEASRSPNLGWEERYIALLWLGHLLYAPFDLATFSRSGHESSSSTAALGFETPQNLPSLASRLMQQGLKYLAVPSKERDAAKFLLCRLVLRRDMSEYGLLGLLVSWSIRTSIRAKGDSLADPYLGIGIISLLGYLVRSDDTGDVVSYYKQIANLLFLMANDANATSAISSTALLRKAVSKALRALNVRMLKLERSTTAVILEDLEGVLEESIEVLLNYLKDSDAPVRLAASKALSQIAAELPTDLVADLVDTIQNSLSLDRLEQSNFEGSIDIGLNSVDPHFWHGLTLTIAQLLFRRLPSPEQLPDLQKSLLLALQFHQQSVGGSMRGVGVRDAACFGIWSLARRYSTDELLDVPEMDMRNAIELFAVELLCSACLDPSGNIRRASSAALQELIGRHPDVVTEGIALAQVVDYQAVARRARALQEVAPRASLLSETYTAALLQGLNGWRGILSDDTGSRRLAAECLGNLMKQSSPRKTIVQAINVLMRQAIESKQKDIELLHGSLLTISRLISVLSSPQASIDGKSALQGVNLSQQTNLFLKRIVGLILPMIEDHVSGPDLMVEAASSLIIAHTSCMGTEAIQSTPGTFEVMHAIVEACIYRATEAVESYALEAALGLYDIAPNDGELLISRWLEQAQAIETRNVPAERSIATIKCLGRLIDRLDPVAGFATEAPTSQAYKMMAVLLQLSQNFALDIAIRSAAIHSFSASSFVYEEMRDKAIPVLISFMRDYTTDERGDVGSLLRLTGIQGSIAIWTGDQPTEHAGDGMKWRPSLQAEIFRLSGDKLDRVRSQCAQFFLMAYKAVGFVDSVTGVSFSLLVEHSSRSARYEEAFLEGFLSICGNGSERVLRKARETLVASIGQRPGQYLDTIYEKLSSLLDRGRTDDRLLLPILQTLAFLLTTQPMPDWGVANWRRLLSRVQKSHYQSANVSRLLAAVHCYDGMLPIPAVGLEALKKLQSMLIFPFPAVRAAAVEALYLATQMKLAGAEEAEQVLLKGDWMGKPQLLKSAVAKLTVCQSFR